MTQRARALNEAVEWLKYNGDAVWNVRTGKIIAGNCLKCFRRHGIDQNGDTWYFITGMYYPIFGRAGQYLGFADFEGKHYVEDQSFDGSV